MFVKFVSKRQIERAKNPIKKNGKAYSNPTDDTLYALGYKPLVMSKEPEVPEGKIAVPIYADGKDQVTQSWEIVDDEFAE